MIGSVIKHDFYDPLVLLQSIHTVHVKLYVSMRYMTAPYHMSQHILCSMEARKRCVCISLRMHFKARLKRQRQLDLMCNDLDVIHVTARILCKRLGIITKMQKF